jgi:hypothetical protein
MFSFRRLAMGNFFPGNVLTFSYPTDNRFRVRTRLTRRRLWVESVRDCERDPVDPLTTWLNPWLRRGRYLLHGYDLDLRRRRSFYLNSARSVRRIEIPVFRLGHYDPLDLSASVELAGPVFTDSAEDLQLARDVIELAHERTDAVGHLRAFGLFALLPRKRIRESVPALAVGSR